jgi:enterochelin esterase-like enzyme
VWLWPRLGGRTWRSVSARVGVLLGVQLVTLIAIGLVANDYFGFYGSWGDLFGTDGGGAPITQGTSTASDGASPSDVTVQASRSVPLELAGASGAAGGTLQTVTIHGASTGLSTPAYVYLPAAYRQAANAHRRFPAVVVLTGYPGTAVNLITRMKYPTVVAQAIYQKQMQPTVLVLMRPTVAPPRDTECQDVPQGPQAESFFAKDLRAAIAARYRVGTEGSSWGMIGDSTGGYCALKIAMRHPEAYGAAASLSGYYESAVDVTTGDLFGGSKQLQNENNLMWRLAHLPAPKVSVLVTSSYHGEYDYKATMAFVRAAVKDHLPVWKMLLPSGGHNFSTWNRELPGALRWLGSHLATPPVSKA